jgi:hypothetical protein
MAARKIYTNIDWKPQPRQMKFLRACGLSHPFEPEDENGKKPPPRAPVAKVIGYGGAAGGGKSDALLGVGIIACLTFLGCRVGYFRRKYTQLEGPGGAIMRSFELLSSSLGAKAYNGKLRRWTFPGGGIFQFCYLDREDDVFNYQSQQFDVLLFDESTQFSWSQISYMQTRIRASRKGIVTFTAMATNPGNIGHSWFKANFVNAGEAETPHNVEIEEGKYATHIFIPAKLSDNHILEQRDPTYRKNLENQPELIRRQLLEGDWDVAEGLAFSEWRAIKHVCEPFHIPDEWIRFRSLDWGYAKPYHVGWYAVDFDGRMYMYRELYGWGGKPDVGTKEDPEDVAIKIIEMEQGENIRYAVADDAIFGSRQDNSPTIAEQFQVAFGHRATNWIPVGKGPRSRISGKLELHHRLKWKAEDTQPPMLVIFNNCKHIIRTLPNLILDDDNPEDVDTSLEDHAYDSLRYSAMSRPIVPKVKKAELTQIQKHKAKLMKQRQSHIRIV